MESEKIQLCMEMTEETSLSGLWKKCGKDRYWTGPAIQICPLIMSSRLTPSRYSFIRSSSLVQTGSVLHLS